MLLTNGPAIKWAMGGVIVHTLLYLIMPILEYSLSECPTGDQQGLVQAPLDFLTLVLYAAVFAPAHLYCQHQVMKYVIVPQLRVTKKFNFLGIPCEKFPYKYWYYLFAAFTCGATMNTLTNAQILGRILATQSCAKPYERMSEEWNAVMANSTFKIGTAPPDFAFESCVIYLLWLVNPIYALINALPRKVKARGAAQDDGDNYDAGDAISKILKYDLPQAELSDTKDGTKEIMKANIYSTWYNYDSTHHSVLMVLSSLARFEAVTFQDVAYCQARLEHLEKKQVEVEIPLEQRKISRSRTHDVSDINFGNDVSDSRSFYYDLVMRSTIDRGIARFAIIGLLQDVMQTNLQTSVVAMNWRVSGALDPQMFFSVVMCFFSTVADFPDAVDVYKIVSRFFKSDSDGDEAVKKLQKAINARLYRFAFYTFVFLWVSVWSFAKVAALFVCEEHIWNFHPKEMLFSMSFTSGCVHTDVTTVNATTLENLFVPHVI